MVRVDIGFIPLEGEGEAFRSTMRLLFVSSVVSRDRESANSAASPVCVREN